jgi:hypothetical protein
MFTERGEENAKIAKRRTRKIAKKIREKRENVKQKFRALSRFSRSLFF